MGLPSFIDLHKKPGREEDESPWLISYSDMVTLLLCFFVVLVAFSNIDLIRVELMTQSFAQRERITFKKLEQIIRRLIVEENLQDEVSVKLTSKGVEVSFRDKLLFDLGKADLKPKAFPVLSKMARLLNHRDIIQRKIIVEGHTDSLPIKSLVYPSNWELSSARAANVVKFFIAQGLDDKRFEAIGYADTHPVKPETDKILGQPENRRVVVVISPESYLVRPVRKEISAMLQPIETTAKSQVSEDIITPAVSLSSEILTNQEQDPGNIASQLAVAEDSVKRKREMEKYFAEGQKYFIEKKYKEAIASWEKVLKLDPNHKLSKINIGRAKKLLSKK